MNDPSPSTADVEVPGATEVPRPPTNGNSKVLHRMETVPDIKKDTSGITTQYIAAGIVNLGAFAAGVCIAWSSAALPDLVDRHDNSIFRTESPITVNLTNLTIQDAGNYSASMDHPIKMTGAQASWIASLLCLGAVFGAVPTGLISEYFGRKKTLLYLALPLIVSWTLVASSPSVYGLYVGRFVGGVAVGAFSVAIPPYVADIAESHLLPTLANYYHVLFSCGILFGYIIGLVHNTAWLTVFCASLPVVFFIAFIFLPESPTYLMSQGKYSEAKSSLRYFRGIDDDIDSELKVIKEYIRNYAKNKVTFKELFTTRGTVKALFVSFGLMIFQQLSGIYPVLFYAGYLFETFCVNTNLTPPSPAIILGFCLVTSMYFSTMLLRIIGRRILLIFSLLSMSLSLGLLAIYFQVQYPMHCDKYTLVGLFTLCLYVTVYAVGLGPIPWLILREIFPSNATRRATAITVGFHWFLAFGVTKLFQNCLVIIRPGWTLWTSALFCIVGAIFVYFFVPETKDRTLKEIHNEFEGIPKRHRHIIEVESVSEI